MKQKVFVVLSCLTLLATPAFAATYKIDGTHSSAVFSVKHFDVSNFYGTFKAVGGTIEYDGANRRWTNYAKTWTYAKSSP